MRKKVVDLTAAELGVLANEAWKVATQQAFANGLPVTGSRDGRRIRYYPDGHIEDLGPVTDIPGDENSATVNKPGRSVA
jgi:hypothetical protein